MSICPKCQHELFVVDYEGIELLKCGDCNGFWFREGKFREVKQQGFDGLSRISPSEVTPETYQESSSAKEQDMRCPDCSELLVPFTYAYSSDIILHRCSACRGIWTDYADLLRIETLLAGYKESLDEAKAKALPLMLKVKKQIQQEREEEQKQRKKGFFNRIFGEKGTKNRKIQDIFEDSDSQKDDDLTQDSE